MYLPHSFPCACFQFQLSAGERHGERQKEAKKAKNSWLIDKSCSEFVWNIPLKLQTTIRLNWQTCLPLCWYLYTECVCVCVCVRDGLTFASIWWFRSGMRGKRLLDDRRLRAGWEESREVVGAKLGHHHHHHRLRARIWTHICKHTHTHICTNTLPLQRN